MVDVLKAKLETERALAALYSIRGDNERASKHVYAANILAELIAIAEA